MQDSDAKIDAATDNARHTIEIISKLILSHIDIMAWWDNLFDYYK